MVRGVALLICVAIVAGCGSAAAPAARTDCTSPKAAKALRKIDRDIAAIRRAARLPTTSTQKGNAAVSRATDVFLADVFKAPISNLQRNRLIDHAAGALVGACEQCFQALEAARPIVTVAHSAHRGNCQK